jgi:hypothetical protein
VVNNELVGVLSEGNKFCGRDELDFAIYASVVGNKDFLKKHVASLGGRKLLPMPAPIDIPTLKPIVRRPTGPSSGRVCPKGEIFVYGSSFMRTVQGRIVNRDDGGAMEIVGSDDRGHVRVRICSQGNLYGWVDQSDIITCQKPCIRDSAGRPRNPNPPRAVGRPRNPNPRQPIQRASEAPWRAASPGGEPQHQKGYKITYEGNVMVVNWDPFCEVGFKRCRGVEPAILKGRAYISRVRKSERWIQVKLLA